MQPVLLLCLLSSVLATKRSRAVLDEHSEPMRKKQALEQELQQQNQVLVNTQIPQARGNECTVPIFMSKANECLQSWDIERARALWHWCTESGAIYSSQESIMMAIRLLEISIGQGKLDLLKDSIQSQKIQMYQQFVNTYFKHFGLDTAKAVRPELKDAFRSAVRGLSEEDWQDGTVALYLSPFIDNYQVILRPDLFNNVTLTGSPAAVHVKLLALINLFDKRQLLDRLDLDSMPEEVRSFVGRFCEYYGVDASRLNN